MTIEERANKIRTIAPPKEFGVDVVQRAEYINKEIAKEITQFFSEIKKRCKEECGERVTNYTIGGEYEHGFNEAKNLCQQAIDRMEVE